MVQCCWVGRIGISSQLLLGTETHTHIQVVVGLTILLYSFPWVLSSFLCIPFPLMQLLSILSMKSQGVHSVLFYYSSFMYVELRICILGCIHDRVIWYDIQMTSYFRIHILLFFNRFKLSIKQMINFHIHPLVEPNYILKWTINICHGMVLACAFSKLNNNVPQIFQKNRGWITELFD